MGQARAATYHPHSSQNYEGVALSSSSTFVTVSAMPLCAPHPRQRQCVPDLISCGQRDIFSGHCGVEHGASVIFGVQRTRPPDSDVIVYSDLHSKHRASTFS